MEPVLVVPLLCCGSIFDWFIASIASIAVGDVTDWVDSIYDNLLGDIVPESQPMFELFSIPLRSELDNEPRTNQK